MDIDILLKEYRKTFPKNYYGYGTIIQIEVANSFEPNGRASETFEDTYRICLPQIPYYWKSTKGWKKGESNTPILFGGSTLDLAMQRCLSFLKEFRE